MMISRRPNNRQSIEIAPGPRKATAAPMLATRIAVNGELKRLRLGAGNNDSAMPIVVSAISPLANGVRNPTNSEMPLTTVNKPKSQFPSAGLSPSKRYIPPWIAAVIPTANRNNNKPIPGHPPGNVENNRCSSYLLTQPNSYSSKTNPQRSESFSNSFVV
jgi:hypothetical protein